MNKILVLSFVIGMLSCTSGHEKGPSKVESNMEVKYTYAMVIHGGAGTIEKKNMTPEREKQYRDALNSALSIGEEILQKGGSAMDAVEKTIHFLEDSPLFNAGRGSVFTNDGENEMDASIMRGSDLEAGAVGGLKTIRHPISAARAVLEKSDHVFLIGPGAEAFAKLQGIETVDPSYFKTERRWKSLQKALEKEKSMGFNDTPPEDNKFGTVGAVALDRNGDIVAGTSTGGMTNKKYDRLGDVPVIGAGTYANNNTCGVSCTGHGEYFIRYSVAHDVSAMMEYTGVDVATAADKIINEKLIKAGGSGGLIALDNKGNVTMTFNSKGMYRGYVRDGERYVGIYGNE